MQRTSLDSVAFQGELGAFSFSATRKFFGNDVPVRPCETFKEVFESLANGSVSYAVIPIENTLYGSIHENYDHLVEYGFVIIGETTIRISHHLIASPGVKIGQIRRAFSHPVALDQCRRFFEEYTAVQPVSFYDTAGSVKMVLEEALNDAAAIGSEVAAEIYGGAILKRGIEDNSGNFTRFFLLSKQTENFNSEPGSWKTSVVFSTPNVPGALFRIMACFALRDLNMTKIESRPIREKPWEYLFYVDITGSQYDERVRRALVHLQEMTSYLKVLGSYKPTN